MTATATMPAVVQYGLQPLQVELREVPLPKYGDDEVLLNVGAVGICGSEVHQYHATHSWQVNIPVILGHEFGGTVVAAGKQVKGFKEGDRVVSETAAQICGQCVFCRGGQYNVCPNRSGFGYGQDGAMTQYVAVPQRCLHHIPDELPFELAAMTEPCCVAYNAAVKNCDIKPGDSVLVLGPGPIGLLCALMAKLRGAAPLVLGGLTCDARRFEVAAQVGIANHWDLQQVDASEFKKNLGDGFGFDVVLDAAGVSASFVTAMEMVRPLGQIVKVGWGVAPLGVSLDPLVAKAVRVQGSFSHNYPIWESVIRLLASNELNIRPLIGLQGKLDDWQKGMDGMHQGQFAKAVLVP